MSDVLAGAVAPEPRTGGRAAWRAPQPDWWPLAAVATAILVAAPLVLWTCHAVHVTPQMHDVALFVHLGALILGFGSVLCVDWVAALFIVRKRTFLEMVQAADNAAIPIWAGYAGLVLSGLLLEPNLHSRATAVKLTLVLVIGLNGVVALGVHRALAREADLRWMALGGSVASVSQLAWWGATIVGFVNAH